MADLIFKRLESIDKEIGEVKAELKKTLEELRKDPKDTHLLAERERLVKELGDVNDRRKNLEVKLSELLPSAAGTRAAETEVGPRNTDAGAGSSGTDAGAAAEPGAGRPAGGGAAAAGPGSAATAGAAASLGMGAATGAGLTAAAGRGGAVVGQGGRLEGLELDTVSPTELLRSALPAGDVHPAILRVSASSQAYDTHPCDVLRWEHVDPEAAGGGDGGGGDGSQLLVEAICKHQDAADSLYGKKLRLFRPSSVGHLNSEAEVATAFVWTTTGRYALGQLAIVLLSDEGMCATWHQQPSTDIIQRGVLTGGGGEQDGGHAMYGRQQAAGTASAAVPSTASSRSASGRADAYKTDLVLIVERRTDSSSSSLLHVDASAAGPSMAAQQGHDAGEQQRPPEPAAAAAAAAAETQRAGGSQGDGGSAGAGGNSLPVEEQAEVEADPVPKRRRCQPRCVCVGELKTILKLTVATQNGGKLPINLLAAWRSFEDAHHNLARAVMSQIYTYLLARGACYGFISCWFATWLVYCPANRRDLLYLSDAFLASTAASVPALASGCAGCSSAATTYGALAFLQYRALCSPSVIPQLQQPGVDMPPTGLGPAADGGSGDGDGSGGGGGSSSTEERDAGAHSGSGEEYIPSSSSLAAAESDSYHQVRGGQELRRAAAAAPEPAGAMPVQQPLVAAAAAAAATTTAAVRQRPSRVLLRFQEGLSVGSEGLVVAGTCDGVDCVIKLLGPDRSGLVAYEREVAAYAALEAVQGRHVPELLAWGELAWGVRFLALRRVAGGQALSRLPHPIPAAVAAAALRVLEEVQAACPGFVHGDVRLANMLVVQAGPPPPAGAAAAGDGVGGFGDAGSGGDGGGGGGQASGGTQLRCVLLDFGRSRLDGSPSQQRLELKQLRQLLAVEQQQA